MHMDNEQQKQGSLGRDFLTYLCYKSDDNGGQFELPGSGEQFVLFLDRKIALEDDQEVPPNTVTYSGDDFTEKDLKQAIRSRKKVREARFRIDKGENTWVFTLKADRFEISGLKIDMPAVQDLDEKFYGRIYSIETLQSLLDACYEQFIESVNGKNWKTTGYPRFQKWLQSK